MVIDLGLVCPACGASFERLWDKADGQVRCPNCSAPVCPCGCGADLSKMRAGALYHSEACRKRLERSQNADITRTGIRSGNVRSVEEAAALHDTYKAEWERRILRRIAHVLDTKGEYHADDIADMILPAEHVNLIGTQVMRLLNRRIWKKVGERRNKSKASNARKSGVYIYLPGGQRKLHQLAGLGTDEHRGDDVGGPGSSSPVASPPVGSAQSGESGIGAGSGEGVPTPRGPGGASHGVPFRTSTASPDSSTGDQGQAQHPDTEPVDAVPGAAQLFDLDDARLAPARSALTDPEAA
jgi:hypothetical protein